MRRPDCESRPAVRGKGLAVLLCVLALSTHPALAHRLGGVDSEIVWRPDSGVFEITHRLHIDDALALFEQLGNRSGDLDLLTSAKVFHYTNLNFALATAAGALSLEPMGAHFEGSQFYIYQQAEPERLPTALQVSNSLLRAPDSRRERVDAKDRPSELMATDNRVNWRVGDIVRSTLCPDDGRAVWLRLKQPTQ